MTAAESVPPANARPRAAHLLAPAAVYLAVRAVGVGVLALMAGSRLVPELTSWDGSWLLAIAEHGYAGVPGCCCRRSSCCSQWPPAWRGAAPPRSSRSSRP